MLSRRKLLLSGAGAAPSLVFTKASASQRRLQFGLTPVFLSNDLDLLTRLKSYLDRKTGYDVQLVQRRTYEEITSLLVSGQLTAAWICGYPFAQYREQLALVAVPLWHGKPLYRSYLIAPNGRGVHDIDGLKGDLHAFSDPNSNSGYLVTAALLARRHLRPEQFFRQTFFTYGHRNVVRAVSSGLAQSGSVDGYVWDVMASVEPSLTSGTEIVRPSELLGFPPVACPKAEAQGEAVHLLQRALLTMAGDEEGRAVLNLLQLDGFSNEHPSLFDAIAAEMMLVRSLAT